VATPAYFDTSVLVKQYVAELGTAAAQPLLHRHRVVSSALAPIELTSALTRRRTERRLSVAQWERLIRYVRIDRAHWELLAVSDAVMARAEEVIRATRVRSLDALHIASALLCSTLAGRALPFITADASQCAAAATAGLDVVWVE
jgi:predicted nucleic acid-binding protein